MNLQERSSGFHQQDWIIIVEALAQWAGPPAEAEGRGERAYELIETFEIEAIPLEILLNSSQSGRRDAQFNHIRNY